MSKRRLYATAFIGTIIAILIVDIYTETNAIANVVRLLWSLVLQAARFAVAAVLALLQFISRLLLHGVGWRRLFRPLSILTLGIGVGYILTNDQHFKRARGMRLRLRKSLAAVGVWWRMQHLALQLAIVAALIASQLALHFWVILFPVGFFVAYIVRKVQHWGADELFGAWYWRTLGTTHRAVVTWLTNVPGIHALVSGFRATRLFFRSGWRSWKYQFAQYGQIRGRVYLILHPPAWRRYFGRPLLAGPQEWPAVHSLASHDEIGTPVPPFVAAGVVIVIIVVCMELSGRPILSDIVRAVW